MQTALIMADFESALLSLTILYYTYKKLVGKLVKTHHCALAASAASPRPEDNNGYNNGGGPSATVAFIRALYRSKAWAFFSFQTLRL